MRRQTKRPRSHSNENNNYYGNDNRNYNRNGFNRISRIVPDQGGCYVRTAKPSGRIVPDQSDGRWLHIAVPSSRRCWTKRHIHQGITSSCSFKNNSGFPCLSNDLERPHFKLGTCIRSLRCIRLNLRGRCWYSRAKKSARRRLSVVRRDRGDSRTRHSEKVICPLDRIGLPSARRIPGRKRISENILFSFRL